MNIQFSYKSVAEKDKKFLEDYTSKKEERLKTLISNKDFEIARLEIRSEKFAKKEAFKVELFLNLPNQSFMSSEDDHTIAEAFDLALDKLIIQLRKHNERLKG
ncbi:MAG: HPF/RaiA family ribosome-associated protein [Candidatus Falkowbacteria bacterium]